MWWRITFFLDPLEQCFSLPCQRAVVGLAAHVVVHCRADPQVIQQQPERRVQGRISEVLAVVIQPCLNKGQQRAGEAVEKSLHGNYFTCCFGIRVTSLKRTGQCYKYTECFQLCHFINI